MGERITLKNQKELLYEGVFDYDQLLAKVGEWMRKHGYERSMISEKETVKKNARHIYLNFELSKPLTEFRSSVIQVQLFFDDMKDIRVKKDGVNLSLNKGKIRMVLDAYKESYLETSWMNEGGFYVFRAFLEKYFLAAFLPDYNGKIVGDFLSFFREIRGFLNLHNYL